jgi:cysteine-rich repeat protein
MTATPKIICGDGIVLSPMEQCDPAAPGTNMDKACSNTCKYNNGWACTGSPPNCHQTKCGDKVAEGSEGCDDGNTVPNDGCSPTCHPEPNCSASTGSCTSVCGDGLIVSGNNTPYVSTLLLHNNGEGGFVTWWKDTQQWKGYSNIRWCSEGTCTTCNDPAYVNDVTYATCNLDCTAAPRCGDGVVQSVRNGFARPSCSYQSKPAALLWTGIFATDQSLRRRDVRSRPRSKIRSVRKAIAADLATKERPFGHDRARRPLRRWPEDPSFLPPPRTQPWSPPG